MCFFFLFSFFFQLLLLGHCQRKVHYVTNPMSIDFKVNCVGGETQQTEKFI